MIVTEKVKIHIGMGSASELYLFNADFTLEEMETICNAPIHIMNEYAMYRAFQPRSVVITKINHKGKRIAPPPTRLYKSTTTYQDHLDKIGYKAPDISNLY